MYKEAKLKYTKVECSDKKIKGWDRRGIRRFNCIVTAVKKNRELSESKDMEMQLKSRYIESSGRENGGDDESDYDDCDLDELNVSHNAFTGRLPDPYYMYDLRLFDVSNNKLTGSIPYSFKNAEYLQRFNVANNRLTGHLPHFCPADYVDGGGSEMMRRSLYEIVDDNSFYELFAGIVEIDVSNNRLSGTIPRGIGKIFVLEILK